MTRIRMRWWVSVGIVARALLVGAAGAVAQCIARGNVKGALCDESSHVLLSYGSDVPSELWSLNVMIGISHNAGPCPATLLVYRYKWDRFAQEYVYDERLVLVEDVPEGCSRFATFRFLRSDELRYECGGPTTEEACCCHFFWDVYAMEFGGE